MQGVQGVLQALLKVKPQMYTERANWLWGVYNSCLSLWPAVIRYKSEARESLPCLTLITGLSSLYLQYKKHLSARPSWNDREKVLARRLCTAATMMCNLARVFLPAAGPSSDWEPLLAPPGIGDAALTQLAGLAKYLHKQHLANQLPSRAARASAKVEDGGNSSGQGFGQERTRASSGRRKRSGNRAARIVGARTFAQLLLYPYHDNIEVIGGKQAIAAQAEAVEQHFLSLGVRGGALPSGDRMSQLVSDYAGVPGFLLQRILKCSVDLPDDAPAQSRDASAVADIGRAALGSTGQGEGEVVVLVQAAPSLLGRTGSATEAVAPGTVLLGVGAKTAIGSRAGHAGGRWLQLAKVPVAQLLLEVVALLCSYTEEVFGGHLLLKYVLNVASLLTQEELLSFCEDAGGLLLQVLRLYEQREQGRQRDAIYSRSTLFEEVVRVFSGALCMTH
jgi:hypothetical protein